MTDSETRYAIAIEVDSLLSRALCVTCPHHYHAGLASECRLDGVSRYVAPGFWCGQHPTRAAVAAYLESEALSSLFSPDTTEAQKCHS